MMMMGVYGSEGSMGVLLHPQEQLLEPWLQLQSCVALVLDLLDDLMVTSDENERRDPCTTALAVPNAHLHASFSLSLPHLLHLASRHDLKLELVHLHFHHHHHRYLIKNVLSHRHTRSLAHEGEIQHRHSHCSDFIQK